MMKILIHALAVLDQGGSSRFLAGLLPALARVDPGTTYELYANASFHLGETFPNVRVHPLAIGSQHRRLWWDQLVLPRLARREKIDLIWNIYGFGAAFAPVPQITWLADSKYYCRYYLQSLGQRAAAAILLRRQLQWLISKRSAAIITPTLAMRDMVRAKHPDIPVDRFVALPHGFDGRGADSVPASRLAPHSTSPASKAVEFLYVGHLGRYKGLFALMEAFAGAVRQVSLPPILILTVSREEWPDGYDRLLQRIGQLGVQDHVRIVGKLSSEAVNDLYRRSDVLVFPSLCESFGFPLQEAMCAGLPVVAVDTLVNREMAGPSALYYAPEDVSAASAAIVRVARDESLRAELSRAALRQFGQIAVSWDDYAERCLKLSRSVLDADDGKDEARRHSDSLGRLHTGKRREGS